MREAVAYCRVSTNKDEQLDSLEAQQEFFQLYAQNHGYQLVEIYADEGKSGTRMRNRTELLRLLADAQERRFDTVLIKDVSRLARNTVDFLTSIRRLKALDIAVIFINYDYTQAESSEFMLTMLSAIAQEESANTSKRVKFGKNLNAQKGRVPNFIYGYNKLPGEYFQLQINAQEAAVVRRIFQLYVQQELGANRIAMLLNSEGISTRRGANWTQTSIQRVLSNQIYIGRIINGKEEVVDFLTGRRRHREEQEWIIVERPELAIVDADSFAAAQRLSAQRREAFSGSGQRSGGKYPFTRLIKCQHCGCSFRRIQRSYVNTYTRWVCSGRNAAGTAACPNRSSIEQNQLLKAILSYMLAPQAERQILVSVGDRFQQLSHAAEKKGSGEKQLTAELERQQHRKQKYLHMFEMDVIDAQELQRHTAPLNQEIKRLDQQIQAIRSSMSSPEQRWESVQAQLPDLLSMLSYPQLGHEVLSHLIDKIESQADGRVDVYFKALPASS